MAESLESETNRCRPLPVLRFRDLAKERNLVALIITLIVIAVVVVVLVFWVIAIYNGLARARIRVR